MEQNNVSFDILRTIRAVLPITVTLLGVLFLKYNRYKTKSYEPSSEIEFLTRSLQKRRIAYISLTIFETLGWLYYFIKDSITSDNHNIYNTLSLASLFITWMTLFVLSITSPIQNRYRERGYIYVFSFVYTFLFLDSFYSLLTTEETRIWDISYVIGTFLLFIIAGTTPQPLHPRELKLASYEKLEIKNNDVYKNGLLLSPEATASIFSWATFQWMNPLVVFGFHNTVTRENIYAMTFQHLARGAFEDFTNTLDSFSRSKLLRRIYECNKQEIWTQFILSLMAVCISYIGPYFQKLFLEYIENKSTRGPIKIAYMYILGLFLIGVTKILCDTVHLWASRRWNIRCLSMLDTELFVKTLKRKDMSGKVSNDDNTKEVEGDKNSKKEDKKEDEGSFSNVGKITNLMSVDAEMLATIPSFLHMMYGAPVEICISITFLYQLLGNAALFGLFVMVVCLPLSGLITTRLAKSYTELTSARDRRNELVNEMLQGIRMIKYFAWEESWRERVSNARKFELTKLVRTIVFDILVNLLYGAVPVLVVASSFIWYTKVMGEELTASVAFVSITLFDMLRNPLIFIPESITTITEAYVSLKRIANYLEEAEVIENINFDPIDVPENVLPETLLARTGFEKSLFQYHISKEESADQKNSASLENQLSNSDTRTPLLSQSNSKSVNKSFTLNVPKFNFPTGKLTLVCGPTGSGKTSFLSALLGELDIVYGRTYLPSKVVINAKNVSTVDPEYPELVLNKVAYAAQQPFLRHASIRDNILFGLPFDEDRYKKTLYQCALIKDLSILPDGDRTEIGEKGISLSGGQKQRVSLARAVYSYAKTVLLDDCLSAVDAHTSKHIYKQCLMGDLLRGRTVILVTHQVKLCLPGAHFLIKIENGNLLCYDYVENLKASGEFYKLIGSELNGERSSVHAYSEAQEEEDDNYSAEINLDEKSEAKKLVQEETSEKGQVKLKVYSTYIAACGGWFFWLILIGSYVCSRVLVFAENWWLRTWASAYDTSPVNSTFSTYIADSSPLVHNDIPLIRGVLDTYGASVFKQHVFKSWVFEEKSPVNVDYYIGIYLIISFVSVLLMVSKNIFIFWGSLRGARILFDGLLDRIIYAPLRFYDTTPVGRILNRFGKDISTIDLQIARSGGFLIDCTTGIVASAVVISAITPQFFIVALGVSVIYFLIGAFYLRISRELKRLNSVSRSPIYSHFTESLIGVVTIRAYGAEQQFTRLVYEKIDSFIAPFYYLWMSNRWLYARIEFTGSFVTFFTGLFLILNIDNIDAGMAGISLFYARSFLEHIYWFIREYTQVEMSLNSVERVIEYTEIEQEPPAIVEGRRPPASWPTTAAIEVKDLVIRYAPELDPVLHGISFSTKPHEKIGIVGRTGSGKSTMTLGIFRFLEPSSGHIFIDGIDISQVGLKDLRSKITIIPQDAVLFSGTIRSNLDPFNEYSDEELWESLDRAHLTKASDRNRATSSGSSTPSTPVADDNNAKEIVSSIKTLNQQVSDGGHNFSQGQRQLICLARALLKNSKLIIMDEATASVDYDTDAKIQTTIREEFVNSTLLCIAHRLRTVIDYDRILVLDQGRVAEFDTPYNLLINNTGVGVFKSMCEKSGEYEVLLNMATNAHNSSEDNGIVADNHNFTY